MVPTAEVAPILKRALIERYGENYESLASGSAPRVLHRWMHENDWAEFDAVDRLFAQLWLVPEVWRDTLPHIYHGITFKDVSRAAPLRCARAGCSNLIVRKQKRKYQPKVYCSKTCGDAGWRQKQRGVERPAGPGHKLRSMVCKQGHDLTPENQKKLAHGGHACRICSRERDRAYQAKRRAARRVQRVS